VETGAVNVRYRYMKKWRASHLEYNPRFHTNCKHVHSCPDFCHINQFHTSTHVLESWTELRSSWHFCSEPSSNTPARQISYICTHLPSRNQNIVSSKSAPSPWNIHFMATIPLFSQASFQSFKTRLKNTCAIRFTRFTKKAFSQEVRLLACAKSN